MACTSTRSRASLFPNTEDLQLNTRRRAPNARLKESLTHFVSRPLEGFMRSELQSEFEGTASLKLAISPWTLRKPAQSAFGLRSPVARGIAGRFSGIVDLCVLSATLIYLALWAVDARPAADPVTLLSMRMSVSHFCMLAFCWIIWRSIFFYSGLYLATHPNSTKCRKSRAPGHRPLRAYRVAHHCNAMAPRALSANPSMRLGTLLPGCSHLSHSNRSILPLRAAIPQADKKCRDCWQRRDCDTGK